MRQIIFRNVDCSARIANRAIHFEELVFSHALKGAAKKNHLALHSNKLRAEDRFEPWPARCSESLGHFGHRLAQTASGVQACKRQSSLFKLFETLPPFRQKTFRPPNCS